MRHAVQEATPLVEPKAHPLGEMPYGISHGCSSRREPKACRRYAARGSHAVRHTTGYYTSGGVHPPGELPQAHSARRRTEGMP